MSTRPPSPSTQHRWYSICSAHQEYEPACNLCQGGMWLFEPHQRMSRQVYRFAPWLWRWWANLRAKRVFCLVLAGSFTVGFTAGFTMRARRA